MKPLNVNQIFQTDLIRANTYRTGRRPLLRMLIVASLWVCSWLPGMSQTVLERVVPRFEARNMPLDQALYLLMDEAGVSISFNNADIPAIRVNVRVEHATVGQILHRLLASTRLQVELLHDQIVLVLPPTPPPVRWHTISGYVLDARSGERLKDAYVYDPKRQISTETNEYGFFSLRLPEGPATLTISYLGYRTEYLPLVVDRNLRTDVRLEPSLTLRQIVVTARDSLSPQFRSPEEVLDARLLLTLPSMGGEPDVVRATHLLPGVQTGADGADGIHVRGGNYEQNLVLLDGVPIYNPFHAFGAFSIFNSHAIRQATFVKSGFPARYGGRLSSVLDVRTREGNLMEWHGSVEASNIALKAWVEGPILPERTALFVSGRTSLLGLYLKPLSQRSKERQSYRDEARFYEQTGQATLYFDDLNFKLHHRLGLNDHIYLGFYRGTDHFADHTEGVLDERYVDTSSNTTFIFRDSVEYDDRLDWGTTLLSLRWNHIFNERLFANTTFFWSRYRQRTTNSTYISERIVQPFQGDFQRRLTALQSGSLIEDAGMRIDLDLLPGKNHRYRFGLSLTRHAFRPRVDAYDLAGEFIGVPIEQTTLDTLPAITSLESGLWAEDTWHFARRWQLQWGVHLSSFFVEKTSYLDLQPRLSLQFAPGKHWLLHLDATRMAQYLHLLRTSNITFPNDLWLPATADFGPQRAVQTSVGASRQIGKSWQISLDGYHNWMRGLLTLEEGGSLLAWRSATATGTGNSYGVELLVRKFSGAWTGWVAYTWSRTTRHFNERVNFGEPFPFRYDRRHDLKAVLVWGLSDRLECSATWTYGTGLAVSLPLSRYTVTIPGFQSSVQAYVIEGKNSERLPPYHRLDLNVSYKLGKGKLTHTFRAGVYNAYNRVNPLYYAVRTEFTGTAGIDRKEVNKLSQVALIPALPYLNYSLSW